MKLNVLVACEYSGRVRDAFLKRGHNAYSCDILPTDSTFFQDRTQNHIQGDILDVLAQTKDYGWDILIAHPPCTDLAVSGSRYFAQKIADGRQQRALDFVQALMDADIPRIVLENPISVISSKIRKPDQIIQPWQFGHPESKSTCLWLKNLPKLVPTNVLEVPASGRWSNQTPGGQNKLGPSPDRWKIRSTTYLGIAEAVAEQFSNYMAQHPIK